MIDSLIYNRTKFVKESEYIKRYVGRTITKGANVYTYTFHSDGRFYGTQVGNTTDYQSTGTIAYQVDCGDDDVYVAVQSKKTPQFFKLSEFLQNGGVSHSPLIHLYHAVSRFRKEISMVDHLLFDRSKWIKDPVGTSVTVPTSINLYQSYGDDVKKIKSYTGKNTVCRVLAKRIYCAVEIDGQTYYIKPQDLIGGVLRRLKSLLYQWKQVVVC